MVTLREMAVAIYRNNEQKGFWDEPRSVAQCADLVCSELGEMLEAERKNRVYKSEAIGVLPLDKFEEKLKDTLQDELADTFIRMLDLLGFFIIHSNEGELCESELQDYFTTYPFSNSKADARLTAYKRIASLGMECKMLLTRGEKVRTHTFAPAWRNAMLSICEVARVYAITPNELLWYIDHKVAYNKTRPHKHGKQF